MVCAREYVFTQPVCAARTRLALRKRTRECWNAGFIQTGQTAFLCVCKQTWGEVQNNARKVNKIKKQQVHTNKFASFVLSLSLVSSLKSGREIHPNASVFCSGSSQAPHHGRIGRTGPVQADCVLLQLLLLTSEHHHVHEQHMLKHCCHSWTNRTFVLRHEDRAETKTCLHKPNCSRGFYCPATLFLLHILFLYEIWK